VKAKHLVARIKQCLAIAECSNCPRRKFGAVLFDPVRNVDIASGYNGAPRGGGDLCGGTRCLRDGLTPEQVIVTDCQGRPLDHPDAEAGAGIDDDTVLVKIKDAYAGLNEESPRPRLAAHRFWLPQAEELCAKLLAENPPIKSGTELQVGCHHAEMNVICNAAASTISTAGAWLVITGEPCLMCAKLLHHAGITKVICVKGGYTGGDAGPAYLRQHGVGVEYVEGPQDPRSAP